MRFSLGKRGAGCNLRHPMVRARFGPLQSSAPMVPAIRFLLTCLAQQTGGTYGRDHQIPAVRAGYSEVLVQRRSFRRQSVHAGGSRYHGMAPLVSHVKHLGLIEARAYRQKEVFEAGVQFARA